MKCKLCSSNKLFKLATLNSKDFINKYKQEVTSFFPQSTFVQTRCPRCHIISFHNVLPGDSEFYDKLQEANWYYEESKPEFDYALGVISNLDPSSILEIGAGSGHFLKKLKDNYNVSASEYSQKSIETLKAIGISLDEEPKRYDFICSFQIFEHVDDLSSLLDFCNKKLNENGYLLITVPNSDSIYFKEVFDFLDYPPHHLHQFNVKALRYLAIYLNYSVVEYWQEELRIEHFKGIIESRRKKRKYVSNKILNKIISFFDFLLMPYFFNSNTPGHTHGILLKKEFLKK